MCFFGSDKLEVQIFKEALSKNSRMKDLGYVKNFLGINIKQVFETAITIINQESYLKRVLEKYDMSNCKAVSTPIEEKFDFNLLKRENSESVEIEKKCIIGSWLYAASGTRSDLSVAGRYQHYASTALYRALKRILRYIKGTLNLSLLYNCTGNDEVIGFSDADWAGDIKDRRSTSGYIIKVFNCVVSWCSRKQNSVALSSAEAEYIALVCTISEAICVKNLLLDFDIHLVRIKVRG